MSAKGHSLQVRPRPLVHKCPLCINTDRKFWAFGICRDVPTADIQSLLNHLVGAAKQYRWHL